VKDRTEESLDEQLARLPLDAAPPGDLWPGIAGRITRRPRIAHPFALAAAAAAAAACLATALTWTVLHGRPDAAPPGPALAGAASSFDEPRDARYVAARSALQSTFRERLALLDPRTRVQIESSLAVIRQAREDIRHALSAAPESPILEELLEATWHDEFDLYDDVLRTTQPISARI